MSLIAALPNLKDEQVRAIGLFHLGLADYQVGKAGKNLTTDSFIKALDSSTFPADMFGGDQLTFNATKHLGSNKSRLSQIKDGKWVVITGYVDP